MMRGKDERVVEWHADGTLYAWTEDNPPKEIHWQAVMCQECRR